MALTINDPEAERLARAVAALTGESLTQAVIVALRERLAREERRGASDEALLDEVLEIGRHCATLPVLDPRPANESLGYDQHGVAR